MVEIKGFNEAYKAMLAKETVKKIHKKHTDNRVKELIAQCEKLQRLSHSRERRWIYAEKSTRKRLLHTL